MTSNKISTEATPFTTPGLSDDRSQQAIALLQDRLYACTDLHLTLKHVHWNVVGPNFIGVHKMIDPQVDAIRLMTDVLAERIATLGGEPLGLPGGLVVHRGWEDYSINRASTQAHLGALDVVYRGVVASHREALEEMEKLDPVTQDILIAQTQELEQFHWFVRAHLEDSSGHLSTDGSPSEAEAAKAAEGA